jgi:threonine/homoserine/homoserine lactone efflux protein
MAAPRHEAAHNAVTRRGLERQDRAVTVLSAAGSFAIVAGLLTITPGLDTALVLRSALTAGRRLAFATALGISTGALIWGAGAAVGVSALLTASHLAYTVLRWLGAAYLIFLGLRTWWQSRRRSVEAGAAIPVPEAVPRSALRAWMRGLGTNLLNPKIGAFYVAILPQFIPAHVAHLPMGLLLAAIHDVEGMVWFTLLICAAQAARRWLSRDAVHRVVDRITGTVLVGFGLKLALSRR